jgi:diacylglycerol kinase family enzyme
VLFINPRSGDGKAARAGLAEQARAKGIEAVVLEAGQDLATLAGEAVAAGADALGMAGGDGSLAVVATAAAAHGIPFVCVPAGTRNHFALDVGVDRHDLAGALDAFTDGVERQIDTAEVNGRRRARRQPAPSRASLERAASGGQCSGTGPRRG